MTLGREASRRWAVASTIASLIVGALLLLPGLLFGPSIDAGVYATVATRLRAGAALYTDVWDHKPPGAYFVDAAAQTVLPWIGPWTPVWIASFLAVVGVGVCTGWALRRMGQSPRIQAVGALFTVIALALPPVAQGGGHTEHFALLPVAAAFLLVSFAARDRAFLGAGILLGIGLLTSLQVVPAVAALAVVTSMGSARRRRLAKVAAGLAVPLVLTGVLLAADGLLPDAWDAVVTYSAAYRAVNIEVQGPVFSGALRSGILGSAAAFLPVGLGILGGLRAPAPTRVACIGCTVWLVSGAAWVVFQGRLDGHYVAPLIFPAGILFAIGLSRFGVGSLPRRGAQFAFGTPLLLLTVVSMLILVEASAVVWNQLKVLNQSASAAANTIDANGTHDDTVFVWGNRAQIYYLAGRAPSSRYLYLAPLTTPGYSSPAQIQQVLAGWKAAPPAFIVDAGSPEPGMAGLPALLIERPSAAYGRDYDALEPLREFVRERYFLLRIAGGWPIYQLIDTDFGAATIGAWTSHRYPRSDVIAQTS